LLYRNKLECFPQPFTSTLVILAAKAGARLEVTGRGKHSSLLRHGNNYGRKRFYGTISGLLETYWNASVCPHLWRS